MIKRKNFITSIAMGLSASVLSSNPKNRFFTLMNKKGSWFLKTSDGKPFFSIGMNHIDSASMRYPENQHIWHEKYGGNQLRWIKEAVGPNIKSWGFNTVGWVQEVTVNKWRHSRSFTLEEYQALDMPYCHMLPFSESHQWEKNINHYDYRAGDWAEWCDYVAREHCAAMKDDRNLIGYFYSDCPTWIHTFPQNIWRGPLFDPERLKTEAGRKELSELAHHYYKTTHDAIRRYDKNHLILGDRYDSHRPMSEEVVNAALPYVDILSFQDFFHPVENLKKWHEKTGKPVLLADGTVRRKKEGNGIEADGYRHHDGEGYAKLLENLYDSPGCIGFHLCGAYQRNKKRRKGMLDEFERTDDSYVPRMTEANLAIQNRLLKI